MKAGQTERRSFSSFSVGAGQAEEFKCLVEIAPDTEEPRSVCPEEAASWGSLELWADGHNLTAHYENGILLPSVSWYLLPFFEWIATNWDCLLHEQRPPTALSGRTAWESLQKTNHPDYFDSQGEESDKVQDDNFKWSQRHELRAAAAGGLFPDVVIRRDRENVELSWGNVPCVGMPSHYHFADAAGCALVDPQAVANALYRVLEVVSTELAKEFPKSGRITALTKKVKSIKDSQRQEDRLSILVGLGKTVAQWKKRWMTLRKQLGDDILHTWFLGEIKDELVIAGNCEGALMFGSIAPTLNEDDVRALASALVSYSKTAPEGERFATFVQNRPLRESPWQDGYSLAQEWAEESNLWRSGERVDIETHFKKLGIIVDEISLQDGEISAIAVAREQRAPIILLNTRHPRDSRGALRFTLAHELCHLLFDRNRARNLALISGPWAPRGIEQRANAFAARLLMPDGLVEGVFKEMGVPSSRPDATQLCQAAQNLDVSPTALAHHMHNRGYFTESVRDTLLGNLSKV